MPWKILQQFIRSPDFKMITWLQLTEIPRCRNIIIGHCEVYPVGLCCKRAAALPTSKDLTAAPCHDHEKNPHFYRYEIFETNIFIIFYVVTCSFSGERCVLSAAFPYVETTDGLGVSRSIALMQAASMKNLLCRMERSYRKL